ncbi:MAG: amino acid ABC transporter permease [Bacilli bacterium]|nr:amino acid ABC transporter permease [Bacilli bacterium]
MNNFAKFWRQFYELGGYHNFLQGLKNTALIAVLGLVIGFIIGAVISIVKLIPSKHPIVKFFKGFAEAYVALFRGTPMVVQLLLMHFGLFPLIGLSLDSVFEAVIIFGMNSGAYMSEIIRSGINAVDVGQMEAGRCVGVSYSSTMVHIILPQAIKNIIPTIGNEFITLIKETSVVSFIAVMDITKSFQAIGTSTYEYFVPYIVLALVYLIIVLAITLGIKAIEKNLKKSERSGGVK